MVKLYDLDSGWSVDRDYYLELAKEPGMDIMDLGCGTGLLANAYAKRGHRVTGVDPAAQMLEAGRQKEFGNNIDWVQSTCQDLNLAKSFDLIIMTGHAFQVLLSEDEVRKCFLTMKNHLKENGLIVFESRNPNYNWKDSWNYNVDLEFEGKPVKESREFLSMQDRKITFVLNYQFPDQSLQSKSELLFLPLKSITDLLIECGLKIKELHGDWDRSSYIEDSSLEMIFNVERY